METTRRNVLKAGLSAAWIASGLASAGRSAAQALGQQIGPAQSMQKGDMLYRLLGKTGEYVSVIGLGGHHIGRPRDEQDGIRIIRRAIDRGITFMGCGRYSPLRRRQMSRWTIRDQKHHGVHRKTNFPSAPIEMTAESAVIPNLSRA